MAFVIEENPFGGGDKYVVRANGRREPQGLVQEQERVARVAKYGALDPDFADSLTRLPPTEMVPVAIYYRQPPFSAHAEEALQGDDETDRAKAYEEVRTLLATASASLIARLGEVHAVDISAGETMPVVFAQITPLALEKVARFVDVDLVLPESAGTPEDYSASNAISIPHIDTSFNAAGFYGVGQKIGLLDNPSCALNDTHVSLLQNPTVNYFPAPMQCSSDADCLNACGGTIPMRPNLCRLTRDGIKHCVSTHASWVASAVSASKPPDRWGASNASLYVPTYNVGGRLHCSQSAMSSSYSWLTVTSGVRTVNESWGCDTNLLNPAGSGDGITQDYYARTFDVMIVKAAGDKSEQVAWGCRTSNALCVGGMDVTASTVFVGSHTAYKNFTNGLNPDREKPDVVAQSENVEVMNEASTTLVSIHNGTSYSAPAMTALAALLKESCGGNIEHRFLRSLMMTSAWYYNAWEESAFLVDQHRHYSTVDFSSNVDFEDGAGGPTADNARSFCGTVISGITTGGTTTTIDLMGGTDSGSKPWMGTSGSHGSPAPPGQPVPFSQGGPIKYYTLGSFSLSAGSRIRVTLNWDACPVGNTGVGPSSLPADLDLFLCNDANQVCLSSRSYYDNWEGFDSADYAGGNNIPFAGTWEVRVGRDPSNSPGCNGSTTETIAWSFARGAPGAFVSHPN